MREVLFSRLYDELRAQARVLMQRERSDHTLSPTGLVHEAYARLVNDRQSSWENRAHFFGVAARAMRQVLIHHARRRAADKRGGGWNRITITEGFRGKTNFQIEIIAIHEALNRLEREDERSCRVAELRLFSGLTHKETGCVLGVSIRTVEADWAFARRWLSRELSGEGTL